MLPSSKGLVELRTLNDVRGNLTFIESGQDLSFAIERVYFLHSVPEGAERGGHAHKKLKQLLVAASGSFDVILKDGTVSNTIRLSDPSKGLLIESMVWRELKNFTEQAVCLVLASEHYDEADYLRDYDEYLIAVKGESAS
jgi:dTDP-4-dehydrorhamnose 3,5-epimerase-like enzyme